MISQRRSLISMQRFFRSQINVDNEQRIYSSFESELIHLINQSIDDLLTNHQKVQALCRDHDVILFYLSSYSSDYNLIEKLFSIIKK